MWIWLALLLVYQINELRRASHIITQHPWVGEIPNRNRIAFHTNCPHRQFFCVLADAYESERPERDLRSPQKWRHRLGRHLIEMGFEALSDGKSSSFSTFSAQIKLMQSFLCLEKAALAPCTESSELCTRPGRPSNNWQGVECYMQQSKVNELKAFKADIGITTLQLTLELLSE